MEPTTLEDLPLSTIGRLMLSQSGGEVTQQKTIQNDEEKQEVAGEMRIAMRTDLQELATFVCAIDHFKITPIRGVLIARKEEASTATAETKNDTKC